MTASRAEVEELLRTEKFRYHSVPLPYGLSTPGRNRSSTAAIVLPDRLDGKSVLDIGCALGYFSFEAEKRGAARVVGTELKPARLRQANLLKGALGSRVEFRAEDLLAAPEPAERFDLVLALNVIHHLSEPVTALERLAGLARERLVLEFPTLTDPKFRELNPSRFWRLYDRLPVMGVSSPRKSGQTFVYSRRAVKRLVRAHVGGFATIKLLDSPMEGRAIAICDKR